MLKKWITGLCLCVALPLAAQVSVLSVTDEDKHTRKEDFWHTFEYYILSPDGQSNKCQATRVAKNWFATAAHCVTQTCAKGCTLRIDLLEQPVSVFVDAKHTPEKPAVFVHPSYSPDIFVANDFALLHMNLSLLPSHYYRRPTQKDPVNREITRSAFQNFLQQNPVARREFNRALRPDLPSILVFEPATKRIDRTLSVISIFDGKRSILKNPHPTDYVKELGFAYTQNFGVRKGMSGSGVMTNTGELAGIISAYLTVTASGPSEVKQQEYFMFPVFNKELVDFMEETMGSDFYEIDRKEAAPNYVVCSPKQHKSVVQAVQKLNEKKLNKAK